MSMPHTCVCAICRAEMRTSVLDHIVEAASPYGVISDGFGTSWQLCVLGHKCRLQVVRPGKAQCDCWESNEDDSSDPHTVTK